MPDSQSEKTTIMPLPTFLGIGTPKSGSTWLYELLQSHPEIWISEKKAEIHYFNNNYHKGVEWYQQFFPEGIEEKYKQLGEYTPHYIYSEKAMERISNLKSVKKVIICCRNPVERAFSHYKFYRRIDNYKKGFGEFLKDHPQSIMWGEYEKHIENAWKYFQKDTILLLTFEDLFINIEQTKLKIAQFLEVNYQLFPSEAGYKKINQGFMPKFGVLYNLGIRFGRLLRKYDLYFIERAVKKSPMASLLSKETERYVDSVHDKQVKLGLYDHYREGFNQLEKITDLNVNKWRSMEKELLRSVNSTG